MTPKEYFEKVPSNLEKKKEILSGLHAVYQFEISGPEGGVWTLDLTGPEGKVSEAGSGTAHCTISMSDENFVKMVSGQLNPQMAFLTGKLKVAGNMGLALKLQKIL